MCDFASHFWLTNWQGVYNFTTFDGISWLFAFRHTPCTGCIGFEYGFKKWGESNHTNDLFFLFWGASLPLAPIFLFVWHMALLNVLHFVHLSFYLENFHEFEIACNFSSYFHIRGRSWRSCQWSSCQVIKLKWKKSTGLDRTICSVLTNRLTIGVKSKKFHWFLS